MTICCESSRAETGVEKCDCAGRGVCREDVCREECVQGRVCAGRGECNEGCVQGRACAGRGVCRGGVCREGMCRGEGVGIQGLQSSVRRDQRCMCVQRWEGVKKDISKCTPTQ